MTAFLHTFCRCCLKDSDWFKVRMARSERHDTATEKIAEEIDIVKIISLLRVSTFMSKILLPKKHQRALVTNFAKYQIDNLEDPGLASLDDYC